MFSAVCRNPYGAGENETNSERHGEEEEEEEEGQGVLMVGQSTASSPLLGVAPSLDVSFSLLLESPQYLFSQSLLFA